MHSLSGFARAQAARRWIEGGALGLAALLGSLGARAQAPDAEAAASRQEQARLADTDTLLALTHDGALLYAQDNPQAQRLPVLQPGGGARRPPREAPLAAPPAPQASFRLNDLRLNGAQALGNEELQAITRPYIGREVTLAHLEALAQAITANYRERGYFFAQAVVPV